jgi:phosphatidylserine decarboxylase
VARAGYPLIFTAAFVTAVFAFLELTVPALMGLVVTLFVCYFFRDPDRVVPNDTSAVLSPADGKVIWAGTVDSSPCFQEKSKKVSIFMSIFNVHVNRVPFDGKVQKVSYHPGKFFSANLDKALKHNEHNAVYIKTEDDKNICVVQIAGLIARRIICRIQPGDTVVRGQRFGLICFGSRLDIYLPPEATLKVTVGDKVKAGTSVLGDIT